MSPEIARAETDLRPGVAASGQTDTASAAGNVDRIREILFGTQMREYGERFQHIEERLSRETETLKAEVRRRLDSLEAYARQEAEASADRLKTERSERTASVDRVSRDAADSLRTLEKRVTQLDEQISKDLRELRQSVIDRQQRLLDELTHSAKAVEELHNRRLEDLRASAVDRLTFSNLLTELSLRIRGELCLPGVEDSRDGGATH